MRAIFFFGAKLFLTLVFIQSCSSDIEAETSRQNIEDIKGAVSPTEFADSADDSMSPFLQQAKNRTPFTLAQEEQLKLAEIYHNQVVQYYQQGQFKQALPFAEETLKIRTEILGEKHPKTLMSLNDLARIYQNIGRLSTALSLFEKAYSLSQEVLGERHPDTLRSINNLAMIYKDIGQLSKALPLSEKVYRLSQYVFGEKHPNTLTSLNNLAIIYKEIGHLSEALSLSEKAYRLRKEVLGEKHPNTLESMNNLGMIYQVIGRFSEALPLSEKAYRLSQEILGERHPNTLTNLNNLGQIYQAIGHLLEALPLLEKNYRISQEVLGERHPNTLKSLNNLAMIYKAIGRLSEALPLLEKAYHLSQEVLGERHPDTLTSLNNLALIYQDIGRLSDALPLFEKNYHLRKEVLGERHPDIINSIHNLAMIYRDIGHLSNALALLEKAYHLSQEVLGERHPYTLINLDHLAMIYKDIGRFSDALPLVEKTYTLSKDVLGESHPNTLVSMNNLVLIYQAIGRLSDALLLSEKNYRLSQDVFGERHPETIRRLSNLAVIYQAIGHLSDALSLSEKCYTLRKEGLGERHPETLLSLNNLATIYQAIGRFSDALPLFEKAYRLYQDVLGERHPKTILILSNLAYSYHAQGQINKAIKYLEQLVKGVEHLRSGDLSAENRQALFKEWVHRYFTLSDLYIEQSRPDDAFRLAELSKARTLLESLAAKHAAQQSGLTIAEQQQLRDKEATLAFLNNRIAKALEDNRLEEKIALETEKTQLLTQLFKFERELKAKYPKYAQLSEVQIISAKEGAKFLPKNAVLISYLVNNNHVLAFTLQSDGKLTAHDLGEIPELSKDLETYDHRLTSFIRTRGKVEPLYPEPPELKTTDDLRLKLGKYLLEPLKDIIKDKPHWIISPNGPLASIAFETLRFEDDKSLVIAQHQISYVQSLSILAQLQKRDKNYKSLKKRDTLLAMGAPIYQETTATNIPNATDLKIASQMVMRGGDYTRALEQLGLKWLNLPSSDEELSALEKLFKETNPRIYKQAEATEANLQSLNKKGLLAQHRYLVFSAHGYLSSEVPALSSIVLGQVNNPPNIDGYVTAGEWPSYDLKSDLMVLSACETGLGKNIGGEGVIGLPYALYVAGNKNTLLTLWTISDRATTKFITSFFKKLKAGMGQIEALTATKREFLRDKDFSDPLYWGAFVLYGV